MNILALKTLSDLFSQVGMAGAFQYALSQKCCKAYLHGLCDSAYSEWGSAQVFVDIILDEQPGLFPCDIEIWILEERFPSVIFRDDPEFGLEFARGRLFSLRDYQLAKEAIANLGEDRFEEDFRIRFGEPTLKAYHLF